MRHARISTVRGSSIGTRRVGGVDGGDLHAKELVIRIKDAEIESMAAVIARDRERVKAEAAGFARQRAEQEGLKGV